MGAPVGVTVRRTAGADAAVGAGSGVTWRGADGRGGVGSGRGAGCDMAGAASKSTTASPTATPFAIDRETSLTRQT